MAQTFANLTYHGVFSTKARRPMLTEDIWPDLVKVVGGIIRDRDGKLLAMNGTADHVHLMASFHQSRTVADMFRDIKAISSDWIHSSFAAMRSFAWQSVYGVFSVSRSMARKVSEYIDSQREHHRTVRFEEELVALLERHGIDYDSRYIFD